MNATFQIKWTVSKARETEGYNICTISGEGIKGRCMGGGYDMLGTSLAQVMMQLFPEYFDGTVKYTPEQVNGNYGLRVHEDGRAFFDGACGVNCVEKFMNNMIGAKVAWEYSRDRKGRCKDRIGVELTWEAKDE